MGKRLSRLKLFGTLFELNPAEHASSDTTYGKGDARKYGHLKLMDDSEGFSESNEYSKMDKNKGIAVTPKFVDSVINYLKNIQNLANAPLNQILMGDNEGNIIGKQSVTSIGENPTNDQFPTAAAVKQYVDASGGGGGGGGSNISITYDSNTKTLNIITTSSE